MLKAPPFLPPLVMNRVCVSTSDHTLLEGDAVKRAYNGAPPARDSAHSEFERGCAASADQATGSSLRGQCGSRHTHPASDDLRPRFGGRSTRALSALGLQAVLLESEHVTRGAIRLPDGEAVANDATALGNLRVDKVEYDGLL